jgi:hypothetical protein
MAKHPYGIFEDMDQALQHIRYRMVIYNGHAYNVTSIHMPIPDDENAAARVIMNDKLGMRQEVDIDDPGFNHFRFDPMGWINHSDGAVLADIRPIRQTRRGYGDENVVMWELSQFGEGLDRHQNLTVSDLLYDEGFSEMLAGDYPTIPDTAAILLGQPKVAIAVSREYLLEASEDGYLWLWRKDYRVGLFSDPHAVQLGRRFKYLKEEIEENPIFRDQGVVVR